MPVAGRLERGFSTPARSDDAGVVTPLVKPGVGGRGSGSVLLARATRFGRATVSAGAAGRDRPVPTASAATTGPGEPRTIGPLLRRAGQPEHSGSRSTRWPLSTAGTSR